MVTQTTNEQRETKSDAKMEPTVWYVYILDLGEDFYVGQTNDLEARLLEHGGNGRDGHLVWFNQASSRDAARTMERRLQRALAGDKGQIVRLVDQFSRILRIMRPEKTLVELQEDNRRLYLELKRVAHVVPVTVGMREAACGFYANLSASGGIFGPSTLDDLKYNEEVYQRVLEATGDESIAQKAAPTGRRSCRYCLSGEKAPRVAGPGI